MYKIYILALTVTMTIIQIKMSVSETAYDAIEIIDHSSKVMNFKLKMTK